MDKAMTEGQSLISSLAGTTKTRTCVAQAVSAAGSLASGRVTVFIVLL